jgi:hypothetical protein
MCNAPPGLPRSGFTTTRRPNSMRAPFTLFQKPSRLTPIPKPLRGRLFTRGRLGVPTGPASREEPGLFALGGLSGGFFVPATYRFPSSNGQLFVALSGRRITNPPQVNNLPHIGSNVIPDRSV